MEIQHFFDPATSTLTYVVHDAKTGVVIDPVLDYDPKSARTSFESAETCGDAQLDMPTLILPAIQINIRAGEFPEPEANGTAYLKIPLNVF